MGSRPRVMDWGGSCVSDPGIESPSLVAEDCGTTCALMIDPDDAVGLLRHPADGWILNFQLTGTFAGAGSYMLDAGGGDVAAQFGDGATTTPWQLIEGTVTFDVVADGGSATFEMSWGSVVFGILDGPDAGTETLSFATIAGGGPAVLHGF